MLAFTMWQEHRRSARVDCLLPVRLYPRGEPKVIETLTKDLGAGGLRVVSPVLTPVTTRLSVELILGRGEAPLSLNAHVIWFQAIDQSEQFYLGLAFQGLSGQDSERLSRYLDLVSSQPSPAKL